MSKAVEELNFRALGTDIHIEIIISGENFREQAKNDLQEAKKNYFLKQKVFSRLDPGSELTRLNKNLEKFNCASNDILYLAGRALFYNRAGGGLFDPRIIDVLEKIGYRKDFQSADFSKMKISGNFDKIEKDLGEDLKIKDDKVFFGRRMDFSGIAKGYITDLAANFLKSRGWKNFLVDSGGDIFAAGKNTDGGKWRIAIEGVRENKLMVAISEKGTATSGISRKKWEIGEKKFHHLVNPKKPNEFSFELRSVSVISKNTENADGRAKVLVLLGKAKGMEFAKRNRVAAIFLDYRGNVFISPEAKKYIAQ